MGEAIQDNIPKGGCMYVYSAIQYLIILSHPAETQIPNIMSRILWNTTNYRIVSTSRLAVNIFP